MCGVCGVEHDVVVAWQPVRARVTVRGLRTVRRRGGGCVGCEGRDAEGGGRCHQDSSPRRKQAHDEKGHGSSDIGGSSNVGSEAGLVKGRKWRCPVHGVVCSRFGVPAKIPIDRLVASPFSICVDVLRRSGGDAQQSNDQKDTEHEHGVDDAGGSMASCSASGSGHVAHDGCHDKDDEASSDEGEGGEATSAVVGAAPVVHKGTSISTKERRTNRRIVMRLVKDGGSVPYPNAAVAEALDGRPLMCCGPVTFGVCTAYTQWREYDVREPFPCRVSLTDMVRLWWPGEGM